MFLFSTLRTAVLTALVSVVITATMMITARVCRTRGDEVDQGN